MPWSTSAFAQPTQSRAAVLEVTGLHAFRLADVGHLIRLEGAPSAASLRERSLRMEVS